MLDRNLLDKLGKLIKVKDNIKYIEDKDISFLYPNPGLFCQIKEVLDRNNISIKNKEENSKELILMIKKYQQTNDIILRDKILEHCMYYLYKISFDMSKKHHIPMEELLGYSYEGLIYAIDSYDEDIIDKVYLYIRYVVCNYILKGIRSYSSIPYYNFKIRKEEQELYNKYGYSINEDISLLEELLSNLQTKYNISPDGMKRIRAIYQVKNAIPFNEVDNYTYYEMDENIQEEIVSRIRDTLSVLNEDELEIIKLYYGIDREDDLTLREIGKIVYRSAQGVNDIRRKGLKKLKYKMEEDKLNYYLR